MSRILGIIISSHTAKCGESQKLEVQSGWPGHLFHIVHGMQKDSVKKIFPEDINLKVTEEKPSTKWYVSHSCSTLGVMKILMEENEEQTEVRSVNTK